MAVDIQPQPPVLVRAEQAESLQDGATSLITLLADAGDTGGAFTANNATFEKGSPGAPAHFHTKATELFLVLDGTRGPSGSPEGPLITNCLRAARGCAGRYGCQPPLP